MDPLDVARRFGQTYSGVDVVPQMRELISRWKAGDAAERDQLFLQDPVASLLAPDVEVDVRAGPNPGRGHGRRAAIDRTLDLAEDPDRRRPRRVLGQARQGEGEAGIAAMGVVHDERVLAHVGHVDDGEPAVLRAGHSALTFQPEADRLAG